jgi:RND family efflux transporter MFP subunit
MTSRGLACLVALPILLAPMPTQAQAGARELAERAPIRGIVRAYSQAAIAIEQPFRVSKLYVREAQAFKKGEALIAFDCERQAAEHAAAEAVYREMRLALESQSYLEKRGAAGKLDVDIARARADKSEAEASALGARLRQCTITAPFDGRVLELRVNEHEMANVGQPILSLVEESRFEIDVIVPSAALRSIAEGSRFVIRLDETGERHEGEVLRVGAMVDPVSQTVKLIAGFTGPHRRVLAGMSGTVELARIEDR